MRVPGLVLQPLLENAVGHGLAPRARGGRIDVSAVLDDGVLRIDVVDDGVGPALLVYDGNDRFNLDGDPTSLAAFEAALAGALRRDDPGVDLQWSNYLAGSDGRVTSYDLTTP